MNARDVDQAVDEIRGEPGPADLDQQYADPMNHPPVRVAQDGPVNVQQLPPDGPWGTTSRSFTATDAPVMMIKPDLRRSEVRFTAAVPFKIGPTSNGPWAVCPANEWTPVRTTQEVWVAYNAADATVSAVWECWTR